MNSKLKSFLPKESGNRIGSSEDVSYIQFSTATAPKREERVSAIIAGWLRCMLRLQFRKAA